MNRNAEIILAHCWGYTVATSLHILLYNVLMNSFSGRTNEEHRNQFIIRDNNIHIADFGVSGLVAKADSLMDVFWELFICQSQKAHH